jgi:hypothetical protein
VRRKKPEPARDPLAEWRQAIESDPSIATAILHDPAVFIGEARCHNTYLHMAANQMYPVDNVRVAALLLEHGADPNARNDDGWTPLHFACWLDARDKTMVEVLLRHGADVNARDNAGRTPLDYVIGGARDGEAIRSLLIEKGAQKGAGFPARSQAKRPRQRRKPGRTKRCT